MAELTSRERILNTIDGKEVDRLPVYDIIHSVDFIEHMTGDKITPKNAEDLTCKAVSEVLDLVRHFTVPADLEPRIITDEDGFVYNQEWWTKTIVERPIKTVEEARDLMKKDVDRIQRAIERKEVCPQALEHLELLGEHCETLEEVKVLFKRIADKLEDTVMIAPESLPGLYNGMNRYGFELFIYTHHDYPEDALDYYKALCDYEIARIDSFADLDLTPIALLSEEMASNSGLLFKPAFVEEVIYPNVKRVIDAWKSHGYKVIFHADGNKWPVLDDIISFGADVIDPCESLATMDVKKFKELYPNTTIASPIDCQYLLTLGTKDEVAEACWKLIEDANDERVLLGSTSEIHPSVPIENAVTMYDILRNYKDM